jgi:hypothetical protein
LRKRPEIGAHRKASSSFLKKRTKKLLFLELPIGAFVPGRQRDRRIKSFLLLFFKKEGLAFGGLAFTRLLQIVSTGFVRRSCSPWYEAANQGR